jgi:chromate reductase
MRLIISCNPYGQSAWSGKPAGSWVHRSEPRKVQWRIQYLRNVLAYLDVLTLGQLEMFLHMTAGAFDPASSDIAQSDTKRLQRGWLDRYLEWVERFSTEGARGH